MTILKDPILYKDKIIYLKIGLVELEIERRSVVTSFNILPLKKDEAVLRILFLWKYNPKIN